MTTFPMPLTTPPDTRIYLVIFARRRARCADQKKSALKFPTRARAILRDGVTQCGAWYRCNNRFSRDSTPFSYLYICSLPYSSHRSLGAPLLLIKALFYVSDNTAARIKRLPL